MTMYKEQLEKSLKNIEDYLSDVDKLYVGQCVMIFSAYWILGIGQCDQYKVAKFLQNCPKIISLEKWKILTPIQKFPKNVDNLGKIIVATGSGKLPKVQ